MKLAPEEHLLAQIERNLHFICAPMKLKRLLHTLQRVLLAAIPRVRVDIEHCRLLGATLDSEFDGCRTIDYRGINLHRLDEGVGRSLDVEVAEDAVPIGLRIVGPSVRALNLGGDGRLGVVDADANLVLALVKLRQQIAMRSVDVAQRADAVAIYKECRGLGALHIEYHSAGRHLGRNMHLARVLYNASIGVGSRQARGDVGGMNAIAEAILVGRARQQALAQRR